MEGYSGRTAPDGAPIQLFRLGNEAGLELCFMDWGATWLSCLVPLSGQLERREVLLRSPSFAEHLQQSAYFGATIGRYANRIRNARFRFPQSLGGHHLDVAPNEGSQSLHGGPIGFDSRRWQATLQGSQQVRFELTSADGDQGFPGNLDVSATYRLSDDNCLFVQFEARCDNVTPINLTNHAYFNLDQKHLDVLQHQLVLLADEYLPVAEDGVPRAGLRSVANTSFDFRQAHQIGDALLTDEDQRRVGGYDHGFLLNPQREREAMAVSLTGSDARVQLNMTTDKPALQLYTGNHLAGTLGAQGSRYAAHAGVALESAFLADSPNHQEWPQPSCFLHPGEVYRFKTQFHFISS